VRRAACQLCCCCQQLFLHRHALKLHMHDICRRVPCVCLKRSLGRQHEHAYDRRFLLALTPMIWTYI
jgi:hypothetical protein